MPVRAGVSSVSAVDTIMTGLRARPMPWWAWSVVLAVVALAKEAAAATGVFAHGAAATFGPLTVTALVAAVWLGVAVWLRVERPVVTLAIAGAVHGVLVLGLDPQPIPADPGVLHPSGTLAIIATNVAFGALLGLIALVVTRNRGPATQ